MTIEQVEAIVSVLDRHQVDYVMIGGIAAELHATLRVPGAMPDGVEVHLDADWLERVTTATFNRSRAVRPRFPSPRPSQLPDVATYRPPDAGGERDRHPEKDRDRDLRHMTSPVVL